LVADLDHAVRFLLRPHGGKDAATVRRFSRQSTETLQFITVTHSQLQPENWRPAKRDERRTHVDDIPQRVLGGAAATTAVVGPETLAAESRKAFSTHDSVAALIATSKSRAEEGGGGPGGKRHHNSAAADKRDTDRSKGKSSAAQVGPHATLYTYCM
jgi:hypothetical protein